MKSNISLSLWTLIGQGAGQSLNIHPCHCLHENSHDLNLIYLNEGLRDLRPLAISQYDGIKVKPITWLWTSTGLSFNILGTWLPTWEWSWIYFILFKFWALGPLALCHFYIWVEVKPFKWLWTPRGQSEVRIFYFI